jgi:hypothetical protein
MRQMREMRQIPIMRDDNDQIYINDLWKSVAKPLPLDLDAFYRRCKNRSDDIRVKAK